MPSLKLIAVRNGETSAPGRSTTTRSTRFLFEPLIEAVIAAAAGEADATRLRIRPSPVIARIDWAPKETIVRKAKGSDNWPLTWADDDQLYTAYGDGWGFEPIVPEKLSLGLARIEGGPDEIHGHQHPLADAASRRATARRARRPAAC